MDPDRRGRPRRYAARRRRFPFLMAWHRVHSACRSRRWSRTPTVCRLVATTDSAAVRAKPSAPLVRTRARSWCCKWLIPDSTDGCRRRAETNAGSSSLALAALPSRPFWGSTLPSGSSASRRARLAGLWKPLSKLHAPQGGPRCPDPPRSAGRPRACLPPATPTTAAMWLCGQDARYGRRRRGRVARRRPSYRRLLGRASIRPSFLQLYESHDLLPLHRRLFGNMICAARARRIASNSFSSTAVHMGHLPGCFARFRPQRHQEYMAGDSDPGVAERKRRDQEATK